MKIISRKFKSLLETLLGVFLIIVSFLLFGLAFSNIFKRELGVLPEKKDLKPALSARILKEEKQKEKTLPETTGTQKMANSCILWVNDKFPLCIVNRGNADGMRIGDILSVYGDKEDKLGDVEIVSVSGLISYAEPLDMNRDLTAGYYMVVLSETAEGQR